MIQIRPANERGNTHTDWLNSNHTFTFGEYFDPKHMGVSNLRVINDDTVAPAGGFPTHGHRNMEIVSYVLSGALEHRDNMDNGSVIRPGDVQRMSAGSGVLHSEYNASAEEPVHFLQIWLQPNHQGVKPSYEQRHYPAEQRRGRLRLLVSPDGRDDSISTQQNGLLYGTLLDPGEIVKLSLVSNRVAYIYIASGSARVNGKALNTGDGAHVENEARVTLEGLVAAEVLLFDLSRETS